MTTFGVGMTLPAMEPDFGPERLQEWSELIDASPFSSLCFGERIAFDNPDALTLLGAVAAWTRRVRITTTVVVPQLHDPVLLAKALATGDRLSGGRLSIGLGVGGRDEATREGRCPSCRRCWTASPRSARTRCTSSPPARTRARSTWWPTS